MQKCREEGSLDDAFEFLDKNEDKAFLWVDEVEFSPSFKGKPERSNDPDYNYKEAYKICKDSSSKDCDKEGGFLNLNLKIPVHLISEDESGRISPQPAKGAEFNVTFYLLSQVAGDSQNSKRTYMLHRPVDSIEKNVTISANDYIHLDNAWLHVPYETTEGTSTLLLKIDALGGEQMEPFFGVYDINDKSVSDLHGISTGLSLRSSEDAPEKLDMEIVSNVESQKQRIAEYKQIFERFDQPSAYAMNKPKVGEDGFDYSKGLALDLARMRFARVKASGKDCESPVKRWAVYLGEVCLEDPRTDQKFANTTVSVMAQGMNISRDKNTDRIVVELEKESKSEIIVENKPTNERGCIQFTHEISHKLYDVQKYFMKKLTFKTHDVEDHKYIALNPWEYGFLTYQEFTQAYENWYAAKEAYDKCQNGECSKNVKQGLVASENNLIYPARNNVRRAESRYAKCQRSGCKELTELEADLKVSESHLAAPIFSENLEPPVMRLNEYRNVIIEPSYNIKSSLDVETVKNLQLLLQPTIVRQDSPGETIRQMPRVLPIGHYLVRVIIAKGPQETTSEGKELIIDRLDLNPVTSAVRLVTNLNVFKNWQHFGSIVDRLTAPTKDVSVEDLHFNNLDARAAEFEQSQRALEELKLSKTGIELSQKALTQSQKAFEEFYGDKSYDLYRQRYKTANAEEFF